MQAIKSQKGSRLIGSIIYLLGTALLTFPISVFAQMPILPQSNDRSPQPSTDAPSAAPRLNNHDREYQSNWGLTAINADAADKIGITGRAIKIGILDTGLALNHSEFSGREHSSLNVTVPGVLHALFPETYSPSMTVISRGDTLLGGNHGTHVAGIIAAAKDGKGMRGVAYNSQLISANNDLSALLTLEQNNILEKLFNRLEEQLGSEAAYKELEIIGGKAQQILFPVVLSALKESEARVINHSWGSNIPPEAFKVVPELSKAIKNDLDMRELIAIADKGILQVWGAGNKNQPYPSLQSLLPYFVPSVKDYWLTVVATNKQNQIVGDFNKCGEIAADWCLAAPGDNINSSIFLGGESDNPTYRYMEQSGTSMAAPHVTGAIALAMERFPYMDSKHIREVILTTANNAGHFSDSAIYGQGLLDVAKAMRGPGKFRRDFFVAIPLDPCAALQDKTCNDWSNDISGVGGLTKTGLGSLTLSGNNTYTGITYIQAGQLTLNGQINSSALIINTDASLRGTGVIHSPSQIAGLLAPGNSAGTLTFNASLILLPQSQTQLDIDGLGMANGAGNYSRVHIVGANNSITLNGTLKPRLRGMSGDANNTFTPNNHDRFAGIFSAAGGFIGGFANLIQPDGLTPGTRFDLIFNQNQADLIVAPTTLPGTTLGDNAAAGADVLNSLRDHPIALRPSTYNAWLGQALNGSASDLAYRTVGGQIYADTLDWGLAYQGQLGQIVFDHMAGYSASKHLQAPAYSLWIHLPYGSRSYTASSSRLDTHTRSTGIFLGLDRTVGKLRFGGAISFTDGKATNTGAVANIHSYSLNAYGRYTFNTDQGQNPYLVGQLSYARLDAQTQRTLSAFSANLSSRSRLHYGTLAAGMGTTFSVSAWQINPELSLRMTQSKRGRTDEQGAYNQDFALSLDNHAATYTYATAQVRASQALSVNRGILTPHIIFGVQQALHTTPTSDAHLTSLGGLAIAQKAAVDDRTLIRLGVGLNFQHSKWMIRAGTNLISSSLLHPASASTKSWDGYLGLVLRW